MASEDYLPLFRRARAEHLRNIQNVSAEIVALYRQAIADLVKKALEARRGSLTQRWAAEYALSLEQRVKELEAGLYDVTLQGLKRSAELPTIAMGQWWETVAAKQGIAGQSFRDAFAATPDNVLTGILSGGFYKDNKGLSERIWGVSKGFENDIGYIVNRGIAEKKSAVELARDLEQYVQAPARRDFDWGKVYPNLSGKKVDFNAQRLARTSINHSYFLDNVKVCTENPFVEAMHWDLSNAHEERQVIPFGPDECDEYAEHDEGLGLGNFKPEEIPVPHPQCLCAQWAVIPRDLEDIGAQIGRWASGEPDALLDEWYDKYGSRNPNGDPKEIILRGNGGELLQNAAGSGRIKTESSDDFKPVTEKSYRNIDTYSFFGDDRDVLLRAALRQLLDDVAPYSLGTEILRAFSVDTFSLLGERISDTEGDGLVREIVTDQRCVTIHNHASGDTFSIADFDKMWSNRNVDAIFVIGHNGNIYSFKKEEYMVSHEVSDRYLPFLFGDKVCVDKEEFFKGLNKYGATYQKTS